jgi:hypothetical protein
MAVPPVKYDDAPHFTPWEMGNSTKEERSSRKLPDKLRRKQRLSSAAPEYLAIDEHGEK